MKRCLAVILLSLLSAVAAAETIEGVVINGTRGVAQPGAAVSLLTLDQGMEPIREAKTDARGHFRFADVPAATGAPYLVRVTYAGVAYHRPVRLAGGPSAAVEIEVYERTISEARVAVSLHGLSLDPSASGLAVREVFAVENPTRPPMSIHRPGGTFQFALPTSAKDLQVTVEGPGGMPLEQTPSEVSPGQYRIDFPLRPGTTQVRMSYRLDYPNTRAKLALKAFYPVAQTQVFVPAPGVEFSSAALKPLGVEPTSQLNAYGAENLPAGTAVEFEVRGTAPPATQSTSEGAGAAEGGVGSVTIFPNTVAQARWYILAFTFFVLALGLYYLYQADRSSTNKSTPGAARAKRRAHRVAEPLDDDTAARR